MTARDARDDLFVLGLSIHGLVRATDIELGRDADTGGQVLYVVDQARALAAHPRVGRVELLTRLVEGKGISPDYARAAEPVADGATIVRIPCGPRRYLRKENLWPYLDGFVDQALRHVRRSGRIPDLVHAHYADAGYVGAQIAALLGVPFVFTGHSLGRVKRRRLRERGGDEQALEDHYHFTTRIDAEEQALTAASLVVASTRQEVEEQYSIYDHYVPERMEVIPPGVDLTRFRPPGRGDPRPPIADELARFLRYPERPMVLALARADERKNLATLVRAFGERRGLRDRANLVVVAGTRDDPAELPAGARRVIAELLQLFDRYDLYGHAAWPKQHGPEDVPELYRLAAGTRGVFVNPALTEPFGLTLIEAAASGLPIVATNDGGPRDIVDACGNGVLVDPVDAEEIGAAIDATLSDTGQWERRSRNGIAGAHEHYAWRGHVEHYLREVDRVARGERTPGGTLRPDRTRIGEVGRLIVTDIDNTLIGDREGLRAFLERLARAGGSIGFGIATGRTPEQVFEALDEFDLPNPDVLVACVGTELYYGRMLTRDRSWERHIAHRWDPDGVREALGDLPGLELQPEEFQRRFKLSWFVDPEEFPGHLEVRRTLRRHKLRVNTIYSHQAYLDCVPLRASPGQAIRFLCFKWGLAPECVLVAGDSGSEEDLLRGDTLGVVVGNYSPELEHLRGHPRIHFADGAHAWGILEGLDHYRFLGDIRVPEEET